MFKRHFTSLSIIITFFTIRPLLADTNWHIYKSHFLMPDGCTIGSGNNDISHSEEQGYGIIFALMNNDRSSFERIWEWTYINIRNPQNEIFSGDMIPLPPNLLLTETMLVMMIS